MKTNPMANFGKTATAKSSIVSAWPCMAALVMLAFPANATTPLPNMPEKLWADFNAQCLAPMEAGQQPDFGGIASGSRQMQDDGANYTDRFRLDSGIKRTVDRAIASGVIWGCACAARDESSEVLEEAVHAFSQLFETGRYDFLTREGTLTGEGETYTYDLLRSTNWRAAALELFTLELPERGLRFRVEDVDPGYRTEPFDLFQNIGHADA